ncbi:MAG: alpha-glucosidase/alpha-galactosidase [Clostridiales bacterium]|nr:alpha-glucosidase/alpha-galactosidase [Clostridiales bacterium]
MRKPVIVFIGAGSMSFGTPTFRDLFTEPALAGATLRLVDIDPENLRRMEALARAMNQVTGMGVQISATDRRREALPGADFVISSLAIERCELWKHDFEVPKKHGVRHTLGENGGPGALFFGMRTIPVVMDIVRDMEELCPQAVFMNFSNPETRIVLAASKYSSIRCIGLCHGIFMARHDVAHVLGRKYDDVRVLGAGMNHFQWLLGIRDAHTGEDLYPMLREREPTFDPSFAPYTRRMFHAFGLWPTCSDDHLGEYQAYGYEAGEHGYDFESDAQGRLRMKREIAEMVANPARLTEWLTPSGEQAIRAIVAMHFDRQTVLDSAIVMNNGAIANLPDDVAVEVPIVVDGFGVHNVDMGQVPLGIRSLMNMQVGPQQLSVEAAVRGSKELALQALLCDPVIHSSFAAEKILDELWEINKPYIRRCV